MAITTLGVLALMAAFCMIGGLIALRSQRDSAGVWLLAIGFAIATIWSGMGAFWAQSHDSMMSPKMYFIMATMAVTAAIYFADRATRAGSQI